jgi:hypothetical protein
MEADDLVTLNFAPPPRIDSSKTWGPHQRKSDVLSFNMGIPYSHFAFLSARSTKQTKNLPPIELPAENSHNGH